MPCNCDHMAPNLHEKESIKVAKLTLFLHSRIAELSPEWVTKAANSMYGNVAKVHALTAMLCKACAHPDAAEVINQPNKLCAELRLWWIAHQEADVIKLEQAAGKERLDNLKRTALNKLTVEDRAVLGL